MDVVTMLYNGPKLKCGAAPPTRPCGTPAAIAKMKATRIRLRNDKWRKTFELLGGRAGTSALATHLGRDAMSVHSSLRALEISEPPVVRRAGTIPTRGNGRDQIIWEWILDEQLVGA